MTTSYMNAHDPTLEKRVAGRQKGLVFSCIREPSVFKAIADANDTSVVNKGTQGDEPATAGRKRRIGIRTAQTVVMLNGAPVSAELV